MASSAFVITHNIEDSVCFIRDCRNVFLLIFDNKLRSLHSPTRHLNCVFTSFLYKFAFVRRLSQFVSSQMMDVLSERLKFKAERSCGKREFIEEKKVKKELKLTL